jgi:hypothetical protein
MSDWKESATRRRDARQTKAPDIRAPSASKKNTKKWCRGKVGAEHKPVCVSYNEWENRRTWAKWSKDWKVLICSECGKQLDYWWPNTIISEKKPCPDWARE